VLKISTMGPFLVVAETGHQANITAPKPRQMFALLALNVGRTVAVPTIIEELWRGRPPPSAWGVLQSYVMQLRKSLKVATGHSSGAAHDSIVNNFGGYLLNAPRESLDFFCFEMAVERARRNLAAGNAEPTATMLRRALSSGKGPALADVQKGPLLEPDFLHMENSRLAAIRLRIQADLRLGRHRELIGELRMLVGQHPFDEMLHGQLMLALYHSGRRLHAPAVYHSLRQASGLEPSQRLRELHRRILAADHQINLLNILHETG